MKKIIEKAQRQPEEKTLLVDRWGKPLIVSKAPFVGFNPERVKDKK